MPKKVAGIPFGSTPAEVKALCKKAGGLVIPVPDSDDLSCTKAPVTPDFEVSWVTARMCKRRMCEIHVHLYPIEGGDLAMQMKRAGDARAAIGKKYGPPRTHDGPDDIREQPGGCADRGSAAGGYRDLWTWFASKDDPDLSHVGRMILFASCASGRADAALIYDNVEGVKMRMAERREKDDSF